MGQNAKMLKEIHGVTDDPPARRRWFHDDFFDLFVWQTDGEVTLFQLCYGLDSSDRALVWDKARGFFHDGPPAPDEVVSRFDDAAASLPDRKSTRLNSSHPSISYAVFCLKKKT